MRNKNPKYFLLPSGESIASIGKSGSTAIGKAILLQHYPALEPVMLGADATNAAGWQGFVPKTNGTPLSAIVAIREPIERFRSACAQERITDVDTLLTRLEDSEDDKLNGYHFRPSSVYPVADTSLYQFPEHIAELANALGLTDIPSVNDNSNNIPKPDLTTEQITRLEVIYAEDITLFNSIAEAGQSYTAPPQPEPEPEPVYVPRIVAAWRIKAIAELQGLTASIDAAIDTIPAPQTKIVAGFSWREGNEISRTSPLILSMAAGLGLDDEQLDGMFIAAASLPA